METEGKKEVELSLAIARMSQRMHTIKKNRSVGGRYKYATLDYMLGKFHRYAGKDIPLGIYFNEKYLGDYVYEMECVLYEVNSGAERRSSVVARVSSDDIPRNSDGRQQVNAVQWAGEKQTYMMRMAMRNALGISPNDDNDCHFEEDRKGYAAANFK
jgi:hypothetical protein